MTIGFSAYVPLHAGATESSDSNLTTPASIATETDTRWASSGLMPGEGKIFLRTLPNVSKPILLGGTTLVPYLGAGFRGGYATEFDRSLNHALSTPLFSSGPSDVGVKSLAGQMIPNEVQVGVRFPF